MEETKDRLRAGCETISLSRNVVEKYFYVNRGNVHLSFENVVPNKPKAQSMLAPMHWDYRACLVDPLVASPVEHVTNSNATNRAPATKTSCSPQ